MSEKWTEQDVLNHARELKSPFEQFKQNGQGLAEKIKQFALKIREGKS